MKGRLLKRFLSLTLTLSMLMSSVQPAIYAAQQAAEEEAFIEAQEDALEEELRDMVGDEEHPEGVIEFGKTLNEVAEDETDSIIVVREGNTDNEASVTFKAVDVSASYGKDYTLSVVTKNGDETDEQVLDENPDAVPLVKEDAEVVAREEAGGLSVEEEVKSDDVAEEAVSSIEEDIDSEDAAASETDSVDTSDEAKDVEKDEDEAVVSEESDVLGEIAAPEGFDGTDDATADDAQLEDVLDVVHEEVSGAESDSVDDPDFEAVNDEVHEEVSGVEEDGDALEEDTPEEADERELPGVNDGLANAYRLQTGNIAPERDWREYSSQEVDPEIKEAMAEGEAETIEAMKETPGVECTLTFAPGEYKKEIKVKAIADGVAESDEVIAFLLYDEKGAELGANYHGYINIRDIDEKQDNIFSVKEKEVRVHIGEPEAKVTIVREGGTEQMATVIVGTQGITAVSGEDYTSFNQELYFAPGITERELVIPIKGVRDVEKSFWVGIRSDREKIIEENNAALVIIESLGDAFNGDASQLPVLSGEAGDETDNDVINPEAFINNGNVPLDVEMDVNGDVTVTYAYDRTDHQNGTESRRTYKSGLNLAGAKSVTVKFSMNGDTYFPWPFSNAKGKKATVWLKSGGKEQSISKETGSENENFTVTFNNNGWNDYTNTSIEAECWGTGCNKNANTWFNIKGSIEVVYPTVTFKLNNGNSANEFVERTYTQNGKFSKHDSDAFYYGKASFSSTNKDDDSVQTNVGKNMRVYFHYGTQGNSLGVKPSAATVNVKGYKIKKNSGSNNWSSEILPENFAVDTKWVNSHVKDYKQSDGSYILMPVIEPKEVTVTFKNSDPAKGNYKGYSDGESFKVRRLDTLEITSASKLGYTVKAIELNTGKYTATTANLAEKNKLVTGFGGADSSTATVNLLYDETRLRVLADPLYKGKESVKMGRVLYSDNETKQNWVGDYKTVIDIPGVSLHKTYNIVGITDLGKSEDGQQYSGDSSYRVAWRDGTMDDDEDGVMSEDPSYKSFKAVRGNVLPYVMKRPTGRIYYNFEPKKEASDPADIEGFLKLEDEFLISHKKIVRGLNGAQVVANYNEAVTAAGTSKDKRQSGDGYFRIASSEFNPYDVYLVNINYDGAEGSINVGAPLYPANCEDVTVKAQDDLNISNVTLYKHTKEWETMTQEKDQWDVVKPTSFYEGYFLDFTVGTNATNTDKNKAYRIEMTADNPGIETVEGTLQFYDGDKSIGDPVKGVSLSKGLGRFRFEFKPDAMNLKPGVTARVKFKDAQGHEYLEREVGIKLVQEVGTLSLLNEFAMGLGGVNIDFLSNVDSRFSMGWGGSFDEFSMTGDGSGDKVLTIGIGHDIYEKSSDNKKTKLQESAEALVKADSDLGSKNQALQKARKENDGSEEKKKAFQEAQKSYEDAKKARTKKQDAYEEEADKTHKDGPEKKSTKIGGKLEISLGVRLVVTYAFDGKQSKYYFKSMMLTAKLTVKGKVDIKFQLPWGFTVNICIEAGGSIGASFIVKQNLSDKIAAEKNRKYAGEKEQERFFIWKDDSLVREGNLNISPYITLTVGAGALFGALKADVSGTAAFDLNFYTGDTEHKGTVTLSAKVSAEVLFVFKYEKKIAQKTYTLFGPEDEEDEEGALGAAFDSTMESLREDDLLGESADKLKLADYSYMEGGSNWYSKDKVEAEFEEEINGSLDEDSEAYSEAAIADKIVENPEFEVIPIGNRKYAAVFTNVPADRVADVKNARAAYFTIYDNGWGVPVMLEKNDKGMDAYPRIFRLKETPGEKGAIIIWSTVGHDFIDEEDLNKRQHGMNLHGRFLNTRSGELEDEIMEITSTTVDEVAQAANAVSANSLPDFSDYTQDVAQNVASDEHGFVVYYEKKEFSEGANETVGDVVNPTYDLFASRYYSFDKGWDDGFAPQDMDEWKDYIQTRFKDAYSLTPDEVEERTEAYARCFYGQRFFDFLPSVTISEQLDESGYWKEGTVPVINPVVIDAGSKKTPVILDSDAISCGESGLFAYTLDMDGDLRTYADREIYMQMYDMGEGTFAFPLILTNDKDEDSGVKFARMNDATWLCYLNDGDIVALDVSNIIDNKLYIQGTAPNNADFYYIDKTAPRSGDKSFFVPEVTLVKGTKVDVDDRVNKDEIASNIGAFDVESSGKYMYVMWSQSVLGVKKGVEEDSYEAALPENSSKEEQLFTMRFSGYGEDAELTYPVQITSKKGAHYRNPAFALTDEGGLIGLTYKAMDKVISYDEFTDKTDGFEREFKQVDENGNETDQKNISKDDYVPINEMDNTSGVPMSFKVDPSGAVKVKDARFTAADAGSIGGFEFKVINDGFIRRSDLRVKAEDINGNSLLLNPDIEAEESAQDPDSLNTVESLPIDSLVGGEELFFTGAMEIPEDATQIMAYISVLNKSGEVIVEETISETLESHLEIGDLAVENTGTRNEYRVTGKVVNSGHARSKAQAVDLGVEYTDGENKLEFIRVPELMPGQSSEFEEVITVDDADFTSSLDENGNVIESLKIFIESEGEYFYTTAERVAYASELERVKSIRDVRINGGDTVSVNAGGKVHVIPEIISTRKNADGDGDDGLQYFFVNPDADDDGYMVEPDGTITGLGEGEGQLDVYVLPSDREFVAERRDSGLNGIIGAHEGIWPEIASEAIYKKSFTVSVSAEAVDTEDDKPRFNDKKGVTYRVVSGNEVEVVGINPLFKNVTKIKVPSAIKVEKTKYNVVGIADKAFENNTQITGVSMGKNVRYVGERAFAGCTAVKSLKLSKNITEIKAGAFEGCVLLKKISLPKNLVKVDKNAFAGCSAVKTITLNKSLVHIGDGAFKGCALVKKLTLPATLQTIGVSSFEGLTALKGIIVKTGVINSIGADAFKGVPADVRIKAKVRDGDAGAFQKLYTASQENK